MRKLRKPIDKSLLKKLYVIDGCSCCVIAKLLSIPVCRIWYQLKYYGFSKHIRNIGSKGYEVRLKKKMLYFLYVKQLKTQREIAKIYNCSSTTIRNYLIKYGFEKYINGYRPKFAIRGKNHPTKRPEVLAKMRKERPSVKGENNPNYGKTWMMGRGNPNWQGGVEKDDYSWKFNDVLKRKIRKRDNYICQKCGIKEKSI